MAGRDRSKPNLVVGAMAVAAVLHVSLILRLKAEPSVNDWVTFSNGLLDPLLYRLFADHFGMRYVETPWMEDHREVARHFYYASAILGLLLLIRAFAAAPIRRHPGNAEIGHSAPSFVQETRMLHPVLFSASTALLLDRLVRLWINRTDLKPRRPMAS